MPRLRKGSLQGPTLLGFRRVCNQIRPGEDRLLKISSLRVPNQVSLTKTRSNESSVMAVSMLILHITFMHRCGIISGSKSMRALTPKMVAIMRSQTVWLWSTNITIVKTSILTKTEMVATCHLLGLVIICKR